MSAAQRRLRRLWFRTTRRLGGGPTGRDQQRRVLAFMPLVAFAVAFAFVLVARDAPRESDSGAATAVIAERRTAAPAPAGPVKLRPTATLPAPLAPPPRKPRSTRAAPPSSPAPAPAAAPTPAQSAPAPAPAPTAAPAPAPPAPTPRAQPQPTPAPTFDDSGETGTFDLP